MAEKIDFILYKSRLEVLLTWLLHGQGDIVHNLLDISKLLCDNKEYHTAVVGLLEWYKEIYQRAVSAMVDKEAKEFTYYYERIFDPKCE